MTEPAAWALVVEATLDETNVHLLTLEAAGLLGSVEQDGRCWLYFPERVDELPLDGDWEPVPDVDWTQAWREQLDPVTVGPLTVAPPWSAEPDATTVVIEPAQAFGTGHHETTAGCLAALSELDLTGCRVLDVGTGSGVLAIAAARLGAEQVTACDTDSVAVDAARANVAHNHVDVELLVGDVTAVGSRVFDVVVANLDTATLVAAAAGLVARLAHGGTLIVSGVSRERSGDAVRALAHAGLSAIERPGREWVVLIGRK